MKLLSVAAASLLALSAASAAAQGNPQVRDGFTISFGLGGGSAALSCPGCGTTPRETGLSGYLRVGGAVSPTLVLSAESNGWSKTIDGVDTRMGALLGVAQWYPSVTSGFHMKGGLGFSAYSEEDPTAKAQAIGLGYQVGAGYDVRMARNFSLTPYLQYVRAFRAKALTQGSSTGDDVSPNYLHAGLGFTWH